MTTPTRPFTLRRQADQLRMRYTDTGEELPIHVVWARPLTGRGGTLALLDEKKHELATLPGLDALDPDSRTLAEAELARRYLLPRITRVRRVHAHFGVWYWDVETDLGDRRFTLKRGGSQLTPVTPDHLVLTDSLGCRYEIRPLSGLDPDSRAEVEKAL